ncbi:uncharacterized protein LOC129247211 [Anastrepha obliqua]|uniref:uncharacterized protein LOC129247211 n=1 Tax=Anastrepha obliqua TaxID=95512 RepID=UPI00240A4040|nr:uncharacterized protein LOC129247211 [Anastrepha obliqua]XP_054742205.1 uncharacterized protein LOC129247211 [Anastrepha obliqua]XP_054742206.1 uncharacterized protein LOC129247211 [Anastrepha obliqua]XP_054742207.1 uncharacterized protein LOC129247211 [Anastrepha obliqua]
MRPKARRPVRCLIWLQTLQYWEEIREYIISKLVKQIEEILMVKSEIECETEVLKFKIIKGEMKDAMAEINNYIAQIRQDKAARKAKDVTPTEIKLPAISLIANEIGILERLGHVEEAEMKRISLLRSLPIQSVVTGPNTVNLLLPDGGVIECDIDIVMPGLKKRNRKAEILEHLLTPIGEE